jgi:hypothetical protein
VDGLAPTGLNGKWGYINTKGQVAIPFTFDGAEDFHEGLASVSVKGNYGYIDEKGNFIIKPAYKCSYMFSEGLAAVQDKNGKWGYINKSGKVIIKPVYDEANNFSEGLAYVKAGGTQKFIDKNGNTAFVIPASFDKLGYVISYPYFVNGLITIILPQGAGVSKTIGYMDGRGTQYWEEKK